MIRRLVVIVGLVAGSVLVVSPASAGGGCHGSGKPTGTGTSVELSMNCMSPRVLNAQEGTEVSFVNRDEVVHNVVGERWSVSELRAGQTHKRAFPVGTHVYSCTLHPGMVGAVVVGAGAAAPIVDARPIAAASPDDDGANAWLLAGLAGLLIGSAGTMGVRRLRAGA